MHRLHQLIVLSALMLLGVGCGSGGAQEPSDGTQERPAEKAQAETVLDPMLETLERAKGVEDIAAQRKAEMDKRIKKETAGEPPD